VRKRDRQTHLDRHAMIAHVVRQHLPLNDRPARQHALQFPPDDLLPVLLRSSTLRLPLAFPTSSLVILVTDFGTEGGFALVNATDFVALGEELGGEREEEVNGEEIGKKRERNRTFAAQKSKLDSGTPTIFILTRSVSLRSNSR
jgi:hypothetical protein